ncbi:MAG: hypothetical protein Ct9H90mP15_04760 [Candidatus Neomarinimicrobiota bacterium]|nr:MAG: hypothetical protein Ct9H90mP15_04760 [Candidatus Neomarinimicrobiota bacterium]
MGQSRNWAQVVSGVNTVISSNTSYATSNDGFTVDVTFGESVTGFTQDDLVLSNAVVTNFNGGDGTTFSFDIEAIVDGEVKVSISEGRSQAIHLEIQILLQMKLQ